MSSGPPALQLVCFDLAGTTVADDGLVLAAFDAALRRIGVGPDDPRRPAMTEYVTRTMGTSKIEVFLELTGSEPEAVRANSAFEQAYGEQVAAGEVRPIPGAEAMFAAVRGAAVKLVFTTGFAPGTRDALLGALGWSELADLALSPSDAGRGRPFPDMVLAAVLALGVTDVRAVAVVGDTAADMLSGRRSGASWVVGVCTGADPPDRLWEAGASHVVASVASLGPVLGLGPGHA